MVGNKKRSGSFASGVTSKEFTEEVTKFIENVKNRRHAQIQFYLSDDGLSRILIYIDGDEINMRLGDVSEGSVRKKWQEII